MRKDTAKHINEFVKTVDFAKVDSEGDLDYHDPFVTKQQKRRDKYITELLESYVNAYKSKVKHNKICRYVILIPCFGIIITFSVLLAILSLKIVNSNNTLNIQEVAAFVTACISFISLIIGLLVIMTKYFFPEKDEEYIATIVKTIQENDLENKRENARNGHKENDQDH